jgi:hypothetical protein
MKKRLLARRSTPSEGNLDVRPDSTYCSCSRRFSIRYGPRTLKFVVSVRVGDGAGIRCVVSMFCTLCATHTDTHTHTHMHPHVHIHTLACTAR